MTSSDSKTPTEWEVEITPHRRVFSVPVRELYQYRDLLFLFVRRDFVANYKQTILGPVWFVIQPILTTVMMVFVFGRLAGLSTDGLPLVLFYFGNVMLFGYFSSCFNKTATTFQSNAKMFGKVYFPRMIVPISVTVSTLITLAIQFTLFLCFYFYYLIGGVVHPNKVILLLPLFILDAAMLGLGLGLIFSALTTKYRDLVNLLAFGTQLLMYASPVVYPISEIPAKYAWIIKANPISGVIENFRYGFTGAGHFSGDLLVYSTVASLLILAAGAVVFNKVEATFMDTV
ncbi:MAG: ABC transporter permease [Puniceicoccales bacterium]